MRFILTYHLKRTLANGHTLDLPRILPPVTADHRPIRQAQDKPLTANTSRAKFSFYLQRSAVYRQSSGG